MDGIKYVVFTEEKKMFDYRGTSVAFIDPPLEERVKQGHVLKFSFGLRRLVSCRIHDALL